MRTPAIIRPTKSKIIRRAQNGDDEISFGFDTSQIPQEAFETQRSQPAQMQPEETVDQTRANASQELMNLLGIEQNMLMRYALAINQMLQQPAAEALPALGIDVPQGEDPEAHWTNIKSLAGAILAQFRS